jgi:hypothetical protein
MSTGSRPLVELDDRTVDRPVVVPVEVLGAEDLGDLHHRIAVDQQRTKHLTARLRWIAAVGGRSTRRLLQRAKWLPMLSRWGGRL